jgi:hypothetical protein
MRPTPKPAREPKKKVPTLENLMKRKPMPTPQTIETAKTSHPTQSFELFYKNVE